MGGVSGELKIENGKWKIENGKWRIENGELVWVMVKSLFVKDL